MTMAVAVIDLARHEVQIVNAGHMAPLLRHSRARSCKSAKTRPVCRWVSARFEYQSCTIKLAPGDNCHVSPTASARP